MLNIRKSILRKQIFEMLPLGRGEIIKLVKNANFCCPHPCGECCHEKNIKEYLCLKDKLAGENTLHPDSKIKVLVTEEELEKISQYLKREKPEFIKLFEMIYKDWDQKYYFNIKNLCLFNQNKECLFPKEIRPQSCLNFLCPKAIQTLRSKKEAES